LEGTCTNCDEELTQKTWTLLDSGGQKDNLSGNTNATDSALGWNSINLVLKENKLKEDTTYIAQLTGRRGNHQATVQFTFQTTSPPKNGQCKVT